MMTTLSGQDLFVFEMANNHQGDLEHGRRIIEEMGKIAREEGVRAGVKFQFRQLDTFIHPAYRTGGDNKHIPRFLDTRMERAEFQALADAVRAAGLLTICTPFDEESVDVIEDLDIEIIKVASCSATDRPLLERIARTGAPVIASTAGLNIGQIDRLVSLLGGRVPELALMHCVALYPTPDDQLRLNQIEVLRNRYPQLTVGFSTHEEPGNTTAIRVAYAKGARIFERHVGMGTERYRLNAYSSSPEQVRDWVRAYKEARAMCGGEHRAPAYPDEIASLRTLMRGVFLKRDVAKGQPLTRDDVFFAMPIAEGQLDSGRWREGLVADRAYAANEPMQDLIVAQPPTRDETVYDIVLQVKGMLNQARIALGPDAQAEISHHYGLERFREFGAVIVTCINRDYAKKLLVMLPRQKHPYHYHKRKEETFQLLFGDMEIEADGHVTRLRPGDTFLVMPGTWHKFHTLDGAIVEEVSTTHYTNDSFYDDERIARMPLEARKTKVSTL
jgi:N-acetylneuraminate synthase